MTATDAKDAAGVTTDATDDPGVTTDVPDVTTIDPRAPRFGQSLTAGALVLAIALNRPALLVAVTAVLVTAVVTRWRVDLYALLWRHLGIRLAGPPAEREPAAPHRFAKLMGATGTLLATALLGAGFSTPAYLVAGAVALAAGLAATTGLCLGCRLYRQVSFARRFGLV